MSIKIRPDGTTQTAYESACAIGWLLALAALALAWLYAWPVGLSMVSGIVGYGLHAAIAADRAVQRDELLDAAQRAYRLLSARPQALQGAVSRDYVRDAQIAARILNCAIESVEPNQPRRVEVDA